MRVTFRHFCRLVAEKIAEDEHGVVAGSLILQRNYASDREFSGH
jgi:hypothetical protein